VNALKTTKYASGRCSDVPTDTDTIWNHVQVFKKLWM